MHMRHNRRTTAAALAHQKCYQNDSNNNELKQMPTQPSTTAPKQARSRRKNNNKEESSVENSSRAVNYNPLASQFEEEMKVGERAAIIPLTCKEREVLDKLDFNLDQVSSLWESSDDQLEFNSQLSGAFQCWENDSTKCSWIWDIGRWKSNMALPLCHELRLKYPYLSRKADDELAKSTCLKNHQQKLQVKRLEHENVKNKDKEEEEPCLCQVRWGLAVDTAAAKRRQKEKLEEEKWQDATHQFFESQRQLELNYANQSLNHYGIPVPTEATFPVPMSMERPANTIPRAIVKTSHLYEGLGEVLASSSHSISSGYSSNLCSPNSPKHDSSPSNHSNLKYLCTDLIGDLRGY